jgi:5-methyltetrahydropteroyltriglutamate--homocysteine methyltransferase|tara:strand:+ start:6297 stop:7364 length:1068 start_codon:yes stop_codon:yes gene_type:complete
MLRPLTTQLVGSYTKPDWLICHHNVTTPYGDETFWRPESDVLEQAKDDASRLAIFDQERAGLDIITDGEQRRHRYDSYFFRFNGVDNAKLGRWSMKERYMNFIDMDEGFQERVHEAWVPRVVGEIGWPGPMTLSDLQFLRSHTDCSIKMTVIGPLTAACRMVNEHYQNEEALGLALAKAINQELRILDHEGVDLIQLDEPDFHFRPDQAIKWGARALDVAFQDISTTKAVHCCYGYATVGGKRADPIYGGVLETIAQSRADQISIEYEQPRHTAEILEKLEHKVIILGVLNLGSKEIESVEHITHRIYEALEVVSLDRLHLAPDCGMWFVPRDIAFGKIRNMVLAAGHVRARFGV